MSESTLVDHRGRPYAAIMLPQYRRGVKPPNAGKTYPAEVFTRDEVGRLLAACPRRGKAGQRNKALIVAGWRAGLRCHETLGLDVRDVDFDAGEVHVRHAKGDRTGQPRSRRLGLDDEALAVLAAWLDVRRSIGAPPRSGPFFCTITAGNVGRRVAGSYVRELMTELGRKAGIEKRVHYHGLRHTFAVNMLREGKTLLVIQKALGHKDLATTYRYLNHLCPQDVIDAMRDRRWDGDGRPPAPAGALLGALSPEQLAQLVSLAELLQGADVGELLAAA